MQKERSYTKGLSKRLSAFAMAIILAWTTVDMPVIAANSQESSCENQAEYTSASDYIEEVEGVSCNYVYNECSQVEDEKEKEEETEDSVSGCDLQEADACESKDGDTDEVIAGINYTSAQSEVSYGFTKSGSNLVEGVDYTYSGETGVFTVLSDKPITISNVSWGTPTTDRIEVAAGVNANITLNRVYIDVSESDDVAALKIADNSTGNVTITLSDNGENILKSGSNCAGIQKNGDTGSLTIQGDTYSRGIITVTGGSGGAGIGGGAGGAGSNITINGIKVNATGGDGGAGIGGGSNGAGSKIAINSGVVTATGGSEAAGIGGGSNGAGSNIAINSGVVTAMGGSEAAGIGGGKNRAGSNITISGGSIKAVEGSGCENAIGGGAGQDAVVLTNGEGKNVYLLEIQNKDSKDIVIDDVDYPDKHDSEHKIYVYLAGEIGKTHSVKVGNVTTEYYFDYKNDKFDRMGDEFVITGTNLIYGEDYTYPADTGILEVRSSKSITVASVDLNYYSTASNRIEIVYGVDANITLVDVYINVSSIADTAAIKIADDSPGNVTITLADDVTSVLYSGKNCAGLQKNGTYISDTQGKLIIKGEKDGTGSLLVTGGVGGAGIGGSANGAGSNIAISGGTVEATGGAGGAGIGGGNGGNGTDITISSGVVIAEGGTGGAGIGGGTNGTGSNIVIGVASVNAVSSNANTIGGGAGQDAVIPTDEKGNNVYLLEIQNAIGADIVIDDVDYPDEHQWETKIYTYLTGKTHTVKIGDITIEYLFDEENSTFTRVDLGLVVTGTNLVKGVDYTYPADTGVLTILSDKAIMIANADTNTTTTNRIEVVNGVDANITLAGVKIDVSDGDNTAAFKIADDSTGNVTITLADDTRNLLYSGSGCAGLQKNGTYISDTQGKLVIQGGIKGTGVLNALGALGIEEDDDGGAGIGGGYYEDGTNITINGGIITATGGYSGAGIGGGYESAGTNITISGGVVTANGGSSGAGIGGGCENAGTNITISGGTVTATGGSEAAGIGGGYYGKGSNIVINGGVVTAKGGEGGAGIGGGREEEGIGITISDGKVSVIGGFAAAGIGSGLAAKGSDITISGGVVNVKGGDGGAGIGGGAMGASENITISGGVVTATGGKDGAGIGGGYQSTGSNIVISGGSVKTSAGLNGNAIGGGSDRAAVVPTDGNGNNVYPLEIENTKGADIVIDDVDYPDAHDTEKKIYAYLPAKTAQEPNMVEVGETITKHCYDTTNEKWLIVVKVPQVDDTTYTYTGNELTYDIELNDDYTVTGNKQTDAGTHTVTVTLKENRIWSDGTIGPKEYEFKIVKKTPQITDIPVISGMYGQTLSEMTLSATEAESDDGVAGTWSITEENKESIYPTVGTNAAYEVTFTPTDTVNYGTVSKTTDITVSKKELTVTGATAQNRDYDGTNKIAITGVTLDDVVNADDVLVKTEGLMGTVSGNNVGTYTEVILPELALTGVDAGNYTLIQPTVAVETLVTIAKADYTVTEIHKSYRNSVEKADAIDLTRFLPTDCGSINYVSVTKEGEVEYISAECSPGVNQEGILEYTVAGMPAGTEGIITVVVETQNYKDITIKVNVKIIDKIPVSVQDDCEVELNGNVLTYGEALSKLTFKDTVFVDDEEKEVTGTLAWKEPDAMPDAGTMSATWVFTPEDSQEYETIEGIIDIVVNKAVPGVSEVPVVAERVYDPFVALKNSDLAGGTIRGAMDTDFDGEYEVIQGTWSWKTADIIPRVNNDGYVSVFTPQDTENYENVEVTVEVPVNKAGAFVTIENSKKSYVKDFTDEDFALEGISFTGEGRLTYTVADGKTLDGAEKAVESIVTVSEDGVVSIHGSGRAVIYVGTKATENYHASELQTVTVEVGLVDSFFVEGEKEYTYTGKAIKPAFVVYDGLNGELTKNRDYTITFKNNAKVYTLKEGDEGFDATKAPQAIIKGKGAYSAKMTVYFTILPKNISDMGDENIVVKQILLEENSKVKKKVPVITYNGKKLSGVLKPVDGSAPAKAKDFVYSYPELTEEETKDRAFKNAGTWKILVEGTGNYTGSRYVDVVIAKKGGKMTSAKIRKIQSQEFEGGAVELKEEELIVTAKIDGETTTLKKGVHYSVKYKNNTGIGTATVILTGIPANGFSGTKSATFKITGTSIAKAKVTGIEAKAYDGTAQTQDVTVTVSKKVKSGNGTETQIIELVKDRDFTIAYDKNVNAGTAKMTIKGIGTYTGTIQKTFKIRAYDMKGETDAAGNIKENSLLTEANGLFEMADGQLGMKYVKGGVRPAVKLFFNGKLLTEGKDYTLSCKNNKKVYTLKEGEEGYKEKNAPVLTIKGKGNFTGSIVKTFVITGRELTDNELAVTMTVSDKAVSTKRGGYISKPVLTDADGKVLKQGRDYTAPVYTMTNGSGETITLTKNDKVTDVGTVITVSVKGLGAYATDNENAVVVGTYRITAKNFNVAKVSSIRKPYTGSKITLTEADFYNENAQGERISKVSIGTGKNKVYLQYGVDFEIVPGSYKNNLKKGTASVTIRGISEDGGLYGGTKTIKFKIGTRGFGEWNWWLFS